jgi:hypothetical protein
MITDRHARHNQSSEASAAQAIISRHASLTGANCVVVSDGSSGRWRLRGSMHSPLHTENGAAVHHQIMKPARSRRTIEQNEPFARDGGWLAV